MDELKMLKSLVDNSTIGMAVYKDNELLFSNFMFDALIKKGMNVKKTVVDNLDYTFCYLEIDYEKENKKIEEVSKQRLNYFLDISNDILSSLENYEHLEAYDIIKKLVTLSKAKSINEYGNTNTSINIKDFVIELSNRCIKKSKRYNVAFEFDFNIKLYDVIVDVEKLKTILEILFLNSLKYAYDNSIIRLEIKEENMEYTFKLTDKAKGFADTVIPYVGKFPLIKKEGLHTNVQLGFAIIRHYIDELNGEFKFFSEYGVGSEFIFKINLTHSSVDSKKVNTKKKIMIVDDNDMNLELLSTILVDVGYDVFECNNAYKAIKELEGCNKFEYSMILMDVLMPGMDGYEATRAIREMPRREYQDIPIIAITANAFDDDKIKAIESGMNDHMAKPIMIPLLLEKIQKYIK